MKVTFTLMDAGLPGERTQWNDPASGTGADPNGERLPGK